MYDVNTYRARDSLRRKSPCNSATSLSAAKGVAIDPADWIKIQFGYEFSDPNLAVQAFTPRRGDGKLHYERLEWLGDAVQHLAIVRFLFATQPDTPFEKLLRLAGNLTSESKLKERATGRGILRVLPSLKGNGIEVKPSVTDDIVEAVIGGIFSEGGYGAAQRSVVTFFEPDLEEPNNTPKDNREFITFLNNLERRNLALHSVAALSDTMGRPGDFKINDPTISALVTHTFQPATGHITEKYLRLVSLGKLALCVVITGNLLTVSPEAQEGELSRRREVILADANLAKYSRQLGLPQPSGRETRSGSQSDSSVKRNLLACIGALLVCDAGLQSVEEFRKSSGIDVLQARVR